MAAVRVRPALFVGGEVCTVQIVLGTPCADALCSEGVAGATHRAGHHARH